MKNERKEKITLDAIKKDLLKIVKFQLSIKSDWRLSYIGPITVLAVIVGALLKNIFVGLLVFSFSGYQIYCYVTEIADYITKKKVLSSAIDRGDISISTETLSHISEETIYEPHLGRKRRHSTKMINVYYFDGGSSWRVPDIDMHYEWSKDHYISTLGLENISVKGNQFFVVRLQQRFDVAYIYPCKLFLLDASLIK